MEVFFSNFINNNEFIVGMIMLFLGLIYLVYKFDKEKRLKSENKSISRRVSDIGSWGIIAILIFGGIILIFR
ncbi:MAG: hypothetical protein NWQ31_12550 [Polaribacter sp.]|nr:hypothetical protein [Polaribacter sp.]